MSVRISLGLALAALLITTGLAMAGCTEGSATSNSQDSQIQQVPGAQTYLRFCFSCHQSGVGGAPRIGDGPAWATRSVKGSALLLENVIKGVPPAMPPKGLCFNCSDQDLSDAIDYMISKSGSEPSRDGN